MPACPMTIYKLLTRIARRYTRCAMNFRSQGFRIESYRMTDRQNNTTEIIYHADSRVVNNKFFTQHSWHEI